MKGFAAAVVFFVLFLAPFAAAWGPVAHQSFCREVVVDVWGADVADECLAAGTEYDESFCAIVAALAGSRYVDDCNAMTVGDLHPANLPEQFFNDWAEHIDYSECPVGAKLAREWVCGDPAIQTTVDKAEAWFAEAAKAEDTCTRVHAVCVGANYLSDRFQSPHRLQYVGDDCHHIIDERVDEALVAGEADWEVVQYCQLQKSVEKAGQRVPRSYRHKFSVSADDARDAVAAVTDEALAVKAAMPVSTLPVSTTAPSTVSSLPAATSVAPEPASTATATSTPLDNEGGEQDFSDRDSKRSAMLLFMAVIVLAAAAVIILAVQPGGGRSKPAPKPAAKAAGMDALKKKPITEKKPATIVSSDAKPAEMTPPAKAKDETEELVDDLWDEESIEEDAWKSPAEQEYQKASAKKTKPETKAKTKKKAAKAKKKPGKSKKTSAKRSVKKKAKKKKKDDTGSEKSEESTDDEDPQVRPRYRMPKKKGRY